MKTDYSRLDEKTQQALAQYGAAEILGNLADIPPLEASDSLEKATRFVELYGPLVPGAEDPAIDVIHSAPMFREAWVASTRQEIEKISRKLNAIFAGDASDFWSDARPVLWADFASGKFQPIPHSLLEALAIELMLSRRRLKCCEQPECGRHFVKQHARHKYCSAFCSEDMRSRYLRKWASDRRESKKGESRSSNKKRRTK